ncbi:MAG: M48 family metallopeptidase [Deltaproteobacteria bacterium]|nr:M48 family metallopeptidase [Deltaproteobacteria bacterium]
MPFIQYLNKQIPYDIERGNRKKTVALHVTADCVTLKVPKRLSDEAISKFMTRKARWIHDRQAVIRHDPLNRIGKHYVTGETFPYLGNTCRLLVVREAHLEAPVCELRQDCLRVQVPSDLTGEQGGSAVKEAMIDWYQGQAVKKITERLPALAQKLGVQPKTVAVKNQKSQWGSCSRSGAIRFNWKIIMAPVAILDYIIVHELCHLIHSNHQPQFWEKVESVIPDCKARKSWLREHSILINALT